MILGLKHNQGYCMLIQINSIEYTKTSADYQSVDRTQHTIQIDQYKCIEIATDTMQRIQTLKKED